MKITPKLFAGMLALSALMPLALLPVQAHAEQYNRSQATPRIEGFNVDEVRRLAPGVELNFDIYGTPGGLATLRIAGATRNLALVEVEAGQYQGTYTIRNRDKITPNSAVTANLRVGERVASATLGKSLQNAAAPARTALTCHNCGTVEAVNLVEVKGEGSYLGAIGGGVVGALLGSQIGGGSGRTAAELAGAVGGAYAGHALEGNARTSNHHEVLVRLQNGATQTFIFAAAPGYRVGDPVKINNGVIVRNP